MDDDSELRIVRPTKPKKSAIKLKFTLQTLALWSLMTVCAIGLGSLEVAFNLVGAISSNAIGSLFPCIYYLYLTIHRGSMY